jgi:hypothetical protein
MRSKDLYHTNQSRTFVDQLCERELVGKLESSGLCCTHLCMNLLWQWFVGARSDCVKSVPISSTVAGLDVLVISAENAASRIEGDGLVVDL